MKDAELEAVVSPPAKDNYFKSSTFDKLQSPEFQELIGQKACEGNHQMLNEFYIILFRGSGLYNILTNETFLII